MRTGNSVDWHIARPTLAREAFVQFDPGPAHALVIFERRRMGKTEFLLQDFKPFAEARNWGVFYFSFMEEGGAVKSEPMPDFLRRLAAFAAHPLDAAARKAGRTLASVIRKVTVAGATVELAPGGEKEAPATLDDLFAAIERRHGRAILILDEIQILAASVTPGDRARKVVNEAFLGALRTALDTRKNNIRAIFNGSSETRLRMMFGDSGAAFFRYATPFQYRLPGEDFARGLLMKLLRHPKPDPERGFITITPDPERFVELFMTDMGRCPYFARKVIEKLYANPAVSVETAWLLVQEGERATAASAWGSLTGLQRAILTYLAKGGDKPTGRVALAYYSKQIGVDVGVPTTQSALNSLSCGKEGAGAMLVNRGRAYVFADELFRRAIEADAV